MGVISTEHQPEHVPLGAIFLGSILQTIDDFAELFQAEICLCGPFRHAGLLASRAANDVQTQ
ncbi:hypothetical protein D3C76_1145160 [compost metagenome]